LISFVKRHLESEAHRMARTGRRRGGGDTREAIRTAARRQFADHGYDGATIRGIASEAGVDPALVMHFLGSKELLLLAGVEWPFDPDEVVPRLLAWKRSQVGERLARLFVTTWDDEAGRNPIVALLQTAARTRHSAATRSRHHPGSDSHPAVYPGQLAS
jgi:AcrR family transcriptional regulator